jgi:hypothetical protein
VALAAARTSSKREQTAKENEQKAAKFANFAGSGKTNAVRGVRGLGGLCGLCGLCGLLLKTVQIDNLLSVRDMSPTAH